MEPSGFDRREHLATGYGLQSPDLAPVFVAWVVPLLPQSLPGGFFDFYGEGERGPQLLNRGAPSAQSIRKKEYMILYQALLLLKIS